MRFPSKAHFDRGYKESYHFETSLSRTIHLTENFFSISSRKRHLAKKKDLPVGDSLNPVATDRYPLRSSKSVIACTERPETETLLRSAVGPHRSRI